jgi:hypothetical protein
MEPLNYLGLRVRDKVTDYPGVVTSVSFDLYGCIQGLVNPGMDKEGKLKELTWFDLNRLEIVDTAPVMECRHTFTRKDLGGQVLPTKD